MSLEKLKDTARKFEQKEDWRKAIDAYLKAIQQIESGRDATPDLSLYNRVGDLYLKVGDTAAAVRHYERAVELYADQGFFNNAIALCGKILRVNPGRTTTYLQLARLHARKNVVIEAKRNLLEYLERMNAQGQLDEAFGAMKAFAEQFSASQDIRVMLVELLRAASRGEEAQEQLDRLCTELEARGDAAGARVTRERLAPEHDDQRPAFGQRGGDLVFLDTGFRVPASPMIPAADRGPVDAAEPALPSLIPGADAPEDTDDGGEGTVPSVGGFEATTLDDPGAAVEPGAPDMEGLILADAEADPGADEGPGVEASGLLLEDVRTIDFEGVRLEGLDDGLALDAGGDGSTTQDGSTPEGGMDLSDVLAESLADPPAPLELPDPDTVELDFVEPAPEAVSADAGIPALEQAVAERPDEPATHRTLAEALLAAGETRRAADEFLFAAEAHELREEWQEAGDLMGRVVQLEPREIRHYQKLVELAYRTGTRTRMLDAYLALAGALRRTGETDKAAAVYRRVLDHDPGNGPAVAALAELDAGPPARPPASAAPARPAMPTVPQSTPPPATATPAPPPTIGADFVDLGSLVLEAPRPRDTRMRIEGAKPTDDEQKNFEEMLAEFKRGIEQNLDVDDHQSHYDLGVAFKEMGLLDEAIAEFQKALRAPEGRLRTSEALGVAFFEKEQFGIAETVLRRAVDGETGGDQAKIGLLYWLGRAAEAQGNVAGALSSYERALAVDIRFMDVGKRVKRLGAGRHT